MKKLLISVRLSDEYQLLNTVKRVNYPYKYAFQLFMLSVIRLSNREKLDPYRTVGRIGYALANDKAADWMTSGEKGDPVHVRYTETNEEIVSYYAGIDTMSNKQLTTLFLRLMIRLCHTYGPHIPDLVYLIDNLAIETHAETSSDQPVTAPKVDAKVKHKPRVQNVPVPAAQEVDAPNAPVEQDVEQEPEVTEPVVSQIRKRKVKLETKPETKTEPEITETVVEPEQTEAIPPKPEPSEDTQEVKEDFLARAQRLKDEANAALEDEPVVTRNPLLSDFYDDDE